MCKYTARMNLFHSVSPDTFDAQLIQEGGGTEEGGVKAKGGKKIKKQHLSSIPFVVLIFFLSV
jgi:hypothetical protein